ncbi:Lipoprotein [Bordetella sputigena]
MRGAGCWSLAPLALCAMLLGACTPTYNWREVEIADGAARANFPARPGTDTRDIGLGGRTLRFSLTSARVEDAVFAVGYAPLPEDLASDAAAQRKLAGDLVRALHENLHATPPAAAPEYGVDVVVRGQAGGHPVWALARVWVRDGLLVEAVATGSEHGLPEGPAREFVGSLRFNSR